MPQYLVNWSTDRTNPRSSSWYVLNGVITHTSGKLKEWVGRPHRELVAALGRDNFYVEEIGPEHIPPTKTYHRLLLSCTDAVIDLLDESQARAGS